MATDTGGKQWRSYADYEAVKHDNFETLVKARKAYALLSSHNSHGKRPSTNQALMASARITNAAEMLELEVEINKHNEPFDEIWERWSGEDGLIAQFRSVDLRETYPGFLDTLMDDMKRAAWHLGYLKVGRHEPADPDDDTTKVLEAIE